jgi:seryl-tRNA synthetase
MDEARRAKILAAETAAAAQNAASKDVGAAKARGDDAEFERLRALVAEKKAEGARLTEEAGAEDARLRDALMRIPTCRWTRCRRGRTRAATWRSGAGARRASMDFKPLEHFDIPAAKDGLDFATAAKLSGSRFVVLRGAVARVHRALAQFMLDLHTSEHGLAETWTPVLVKEEAMYGTNQLPKFAEDSYQTTNGWWLIPTSEVTLTNSVAGDILDEAALPLRMTAHTHCFRSEAGSAGKDTTGMLRQHQFEKVEMVTICTPETALAEHERMTKCAEAVLERLGLPYRTIVLCTGDMGFGAQKTHDLEVWLPGQNTYPRDFSSVSTCGQFQARRMNARYRPARSGRQAGVRGDAERVGPGRRALPDRGAGERARGGRVSDLANGAGALSSRQDPDYGRGCADLTGTPLGRRMFSPQLFWSGVSDVPPSCADPASGDSCLWRGPLGDSALHRL